MVDYLSRKRSKFKLRWFGLNYDVVFEDGGPNYILKKGRCYFIYTCFWWLCYYYLTGYRSKWWRMFFILERRFTNCLQTKRQWHMRRGTPRQDRGIPYFSCKSYRPKYNGTLLEWLLRNLAMLYITL